MRTILIGILASLAACTAAGPTDSSDQLDDPSGKADGVTDPSGAYTNATPHFGELTTLSLQGDHTFNSSQIVACPGGGTCDPLVQQGTYLFTHSSTKHYIRLYATDGTDLARYQWKLDGSKLELELDGDTSFFSMDAGGDCESSGGSCVALAPDTCDNGTVGDANEYSCGSGEGVACCLPSQTAPSFTADSDCTGALPDVCRVCSDNTEQCAHWSCVDNACEIVSCPS